MSLVSLDFPFIFIDFCWFSMLCLSTRRFYSMSIDFCWVCIAFITFAVPKYLKTFEKINEFSMILLFWATLINIGQHWSTLINIGQHHSPLIHIDQPWSTFINTNVEQHWSILIASDQHWATLANTDQHWSTLVNVNQHRQHWPTLINIVQHWPTLINNDHHWWTLIERAFLSHSIPSPLLCVHQRSRNPHTGFWKLRNLEAVISFRNLTLCKKFNFASKPQFFNQAWSFNTPHPTNPAILSPSSHPALGRWNARSDWINLTLKLSQRNPN